MEPSVRYNDGRDERVLFTLPKSLTDRDSVLFFALPKAGNIMLNAIIASLGGKPVWSMSTSPESTSGWVAARGLAEINGGHLSR